MYLRSKKRKGKTYYYLVEKIDGRQKVIKYLGTAENILKQFDGGVQLHFGRR